MSLIILKDLQIPISIETQIQNLIDKNLIITNVEFAKSFLSEVSYYRFIKAYSLGLKDEEGNYKENISFEKIADLYNFNTQLRQILFPIIEYIEISLRCKVSNYFSLKHGNLGYKSPSNFNNTEYFNIFTQELSNEISRNKNLPYIKKFTNEYIDGNLPFYAAIELFSFGMLSKFYCNLKSEDKKAVAGEFYVDQMYFESWIKNISFVRNICAHYSRLYNMKLKKIPKLYKKYYSVPNNSIFATILSLKHLTDTEPIWWTFKDNLIGLIGEYKDSINLSYIGFTDDWEKLL